MGKTVNTYRWKLAEARQHAQVAAFWCAAVLDKDDYATLLWAAVEENTLSAIDFVIAENDRNTRENMMRQSRGR